MTDCTPVYTLWQLTQDLLAAVGIAALFAVVAMTLRYWFEKLMDAMAVDL